LRKDYFTLLTIWVYVQAGADDAPAGDGQGDAAGGGTGGARNKARVIEVAVAATTMEAVAPDVAEAPREPEALHQSEV
jgi:hypothetical protein